MCGSVVRKLLILKACLVDGILPVYGILDSKFREEELRRNQLDDQTQFGIEMIECVSTCQCMSVSEDSEPGSLEKTFNF